MKQSILALSALSLAFSIGAHATTTADVEVTGTISPTPCTINTPEFYEFPAQFFGDITNDTDVLESWDRLIPNAISISVNCSAETDIALIGNTPNNEADFRGQSRFSMPFDGHFSITNGLRPMLNSDNVQAAYFNLKRNDQVVMETFVTEDGFATFNCVAAGEYGLPNYPNTSRQPLRQRGLCDTVTGNTTYDFDVEIVYVKSRLSDVDVNILTSVIELEVFYR